MRWLCSIAALSLASACGPRAPVTEPPVEETPEPVPEAPDEEVVVGPPDEPVGEPWTVVTEEDFAIAVPDGWRQFDVPDETVVLLRVGDGIGIPPTDEHGEPLQAGIAVETHEGPFESPADFADQLLDHLTADPASELEREPLRRPVELCDGSPAEFLAVQFRRPEEARKSLFTQLVATDEEGVGWTASGYMISGLQSELTDMDSLAAGWLAAHVLTWCPEPEQFSDEGLRAVYQVVEQVRRGLEAMEDEVRQGEERGLQEERRRR